MDDNYTFAEWQQARNIAGARDKQAQNILAPREHQALIRESTQENPAVGLGLALGSIPYNAVFKPANKALRGLGYTENDFPAINNSAIMQKFGEKLGQADWSDPSVSAVLRAFLGLGQGVKALTMEKMLNK